MSSAFLGIERFIYDYFFILICTFSFRLIRLNLPEMGFKKKVLAYSQLRYVILDFQIKIIHK